MGTQTPRTPAPEKSFPYCPPSWQWLNSAVVEPEEYQRRVQQLRYGCGQMRGILIRSWLHKPCAGLHPAFRPFRVRLSMRVRVIPSFIRILTNDANRHLNKPCQITCNQLKAMKLLALHSSETALRRQRRAKPISKLGHRRRHQPGENVCVAGNFGLIPQRQEGAVTASPSANCAPSPACRAWRARPAWPNRTLRRRRSWRTSTRNSGATLGDGAQTASCWRGVGMTDVRRASAVSSPG